jgi:N6-L-threonylcarbamoyladenine synthase
LIVSGGHTLLVHTRGLGDYGLVGRTVDDAAGEAFDKVAKLLGLGYPGGPEIEKLARQGDRQRFALPRSMLDSENFSFSGLKTAVRYLLEKLRQDGAAKQVSGNPADPPAPSGVASEVLNDVCASFQQAIIDVLVDKTIAAARKHGVKVVTLSGGVSCNSELRRQLGETCEREGLRLKAAEPWLCTDNAAMIAFAGLLRIEAGFESSVGEEIDPNLAIA